MKTVTIKASKILNWEEFHAYFSDLFGFPDFYGKNMNAWIDCITYLDDPRSGMNSKISVASNDLIVFEIDDAKLLKEQAEDIYLSLIECCAFVNHRRMESGGNPLIVVSFF
jgi:hypothetical protein